MNNNTHYYFLPSLRTGLAANDQLVLDKESRRLRFDASIQMRVHVKDGAAETQEPIKQQIYLYGPRDIIGFDPRIVARTEPQPDVSAFEYNFFPAIEFADADFPWRYTPDNPEKNTGKLQPWLTLIVLTAETSGGEVVKEFEESLPDHPNLPSCISVDPKVLPDLRYAWRWAHVQVTGEKTDDPNSLLTNAQCGAVSRLMCARRLRPNVRYAAFVVPTFKTGLQAALGLGADSGASPLDPAWTLQNEPATGEVSGRQTIKLPYYYRWEFRTGETADFEYLVRLLKPRKLSNAGIRNIDCAQPGFGTHGVNRNETPPNESAYLGMEGALMAEDASPTPWGMDNQHSEILREDIAALINGQCNAGLMSISAVTIETLPGSNSVKLSWTSSDTSTARIDYGLFPCYGFNKRISTRQRSHQITLTGLLPGRLYYFRIRAESIDGTFVESKGNFTIPVLPCVAPPIYGRWHKAADRVSSEQEGWIHELNLDPRHRTAAGLGAEVVRRQQESLMAGAWDQLGPIETVNDELRRIQFGREISKPLFRRIKELPLERAVELMAPAARRIMVQDPETQETYTGAYCLHKFSPIHASLTDQSFRRLFNPFSPILSRQRLFQPQNEHPFDPNFLRRLSMDDPNLDLDVDNAIADNPLSNSAGILNLQKEVASIKSTFDKLNKASSEISFPSERPSTFLPNIKNQMVDALNPETTLVERARNRLRLAEKLEQKFDQETTSDCLDPIMWAPEFTAAMYKPLRDISDESLLPGVEKIPQNTIGILYENRRFIEAYLCGLNHEFASELLWRGYPTDQRGSYFRQFWDVSGFIPNPSELTELLHNWLKKPWLPLIVTYGNKELLNLLTSWLEKNNYESVNDIPPTEQDKIFNRHRDEILDISHLSSPQRISLVSLLIQRDCLIEKLKDIKPINQWRNASLGENISEFSKQSLQEEPNLVLVIRGELLKRYPDAAFYAIDFDPDDENTADRNLYKNLVTPSFQATLPPDLTFFGFPFTKQEALQSQNTQEKYFVIEEHITHIHFGLDESIWQSLGLEGTFGYYLDSVIEQVNLSQATVQSEFNADKSSADLASMTLQAPVRMLIPAKRMITKPSD